MVVQFNTVGSDSPQILWAKIQNTLKAKLTCESQVRDQTLYQTTLLQTASRVNMINKGYLYYRGLQIS